MLLTAKIALKPIAGPLFLTTGLKNGMTSLRLSRTPSCCLFKTLAKLNMLLTGKNSFIRQRQLSMDGLTMVMTFTERTSLQFWVILDTAATQGLSSKSLTKKKTDRRNTLSYLTVKVSGQQLEKKTAATWATGRMANATAME